MDEYAYKAVLVVPGAHWFRSNDLDGVSKRIRALKRGGSPYKSGFITIKNEDDLQYIEKLVKVLKQMTDFNIRVEIPLVSVYTNLPTDIDKLCSLDSERVKYISKPPSQGLDKNIVVMNRTGWDFKITLGPTSQNYSNFVEWAENGKDLVKLTGSAKRALMRDSHWGGSHFYAKNDKAVTMTRAFLGDTISRVDQVVNLKD